MSYDEDPTAGAAEQGLVCFNRMQCGPRVVQVDLDSEEALEHFRWAMERLAGEDGPLTGSYLLTVSKSGGHHAYVETAEFTSWKERIMLAGCLGSDARRNTLNVMRYLCMPGVRCRPGWEECLFETPGEAPKVEDWLKARREEHDA